MPERGCTFQYYVIDSATIIGLLDEQLGNSDGTLHAWIGVFKVNVETKASNSYSDSQS